MTEVGEESNAIEARCLGNFDWCVVLQLHAKIEENGVDLQTMGLDIVQSSWGDFNTIWIELFPVALSRYFFCYGPGVSVPSFLLV